MTKKPNISVNDVEWGNIELPGLSDEELYKKNWNYSRKYSKSYQDSMKKLHSSEEYNQKRLDAMKESSEYQKRGATISKRKVLLTQSQVDDIWEECWTDKRGSSLYKELSEQYGVKVPTIMQIATGNHFLKKVDAKEVSLLKLEWNKKYSHLKGNRIKEKKLGHIVTEETRNKIANTLKLRNKNEQ